MSVNYLAPPFELVVRPAQEGAIRPGPALGLRKPPKPEDDNLITWGSSGSTIFQVSAHAKATVPEPEWPDSKETQRTYDIVKVKNPDDSEQFVEVEAMTEYQARNKINKNRITLRYEPQTSGANVEVISRNNVRKGSTT